MRHMNVFEYLCGQIAKCCITFLKIVSVTGRGNNFEKTSNGKVVNSKDSWDYIEY